MIWLRYIGTSIMEQTRMHGFGSYPLITVRDSSAGRYVATDSFTGRSLRSDRTRGLVGCCRSLRSNRPSRLVGRYIAIDSFVGRSLRPSGLVGRYVATGSLADWSLRGDLVWIHFGCFMNVFLGYGSLKEISSELTIRGRYEEEAIVRCRSSAVDRYRREASTIENYDRSLYILYHRSMSRREMPDLVPADFKPKASPNYKITPDEFLT
ncbi:hypothetical protein DY000_02007130 [Brassica cretica]|uniref:Uncharacterized protein n=1 Tax=Brassica cretica TaxID=69181 RepID=A0ABQ7C5E5_BRACR|nr:hypothetical protein DY000_02007130 [Brassica cretica]